MDEWSKWVGDTGWKGFVVWHVQQQGYLEKGPTRSVTHFPHDQLSSSSGDYKTLLPLKGTRPRQE